MENTFLYTVGLNPTITLKPLVDNNEELSIEERARLFYIGVYMKEHPDKIALHRPFIVNKSKYYIHSILRNENIDGKLNDCVSGDFIFYAINLKRGPEKNRKKFIKAVRFAVDMDKTLA